MAEVELILVVHEINNFLLFRFVLNNFCVQGDFLALDFDVLLFLEISKGEVFRVLTFVGRFAQFHHTHIQLEVNQRQNHNIREERIFFFFVESNGKQVSRKAGFLTNLEKVFIVNRVRKGHLEIK